MHLLLRNCHVISPAQNINGRFDIMIYNGVIIRMGIIWQHVRECIHYDLDGMIVAPGFFDMHVHFREPGQTHKETISSGINAAANGGITGVLMMPNTQPPIDNVKIISQNKLKAQNKIVDVYTAACATVNREGKRLTDIESLVKQGALAVTDDGSPIENDFIMEEVLNMSSVLSVPIVQHCEFTSISDGGVINEGDVASKLGVKGIPNSAEYEMIERDIDLLRKYPRARYHVQHISTKESVELVKRAKSEGLNISCEACPHHFILTEDAVLQYGTDAKMNPPLRKKEDVMAIKEGLKDRTIDVVCTDHAPHSQDEKSLGLGKAPFGIVGLETSIALTYTYLVKTGVITLEDMITKMSVNPRRLLGLPDIKISEGEIANFTILDLKNKWRIDKNLFKSMSQNTPFNGWEVECKPLGIVKAEKFQLKI
jgi:dihydroorotase